MFLRHIIELFLEESPKLMATIGTSIAERDAQALQLQAHSLKGSIAIFGDQRTHDAALRLEHMGRDAEFDGADEAWQTLERETLRLKKGLVKLLRQEGGD